MGAVVGGHKLGEPDALRRRRRFVPRAGFAAMSADAPALGLEAFRADQDTVAEQELSDPYED
ncbi:hypothetical protein [Actinomadura litoris]|uniref:hypothetical protein n=1 Tax=Actinomadura litoris TaxID=2678616 RepID=UPI001FA80A75|nr:hypothetical protein [Actinomadura litoris]